MAEKVRNWAPLFSGRENVEVELFTECVIGGEAHLMTYFLLREWRASLFDALNGVLISRRGSLHLEPAASQKFFYYFHTL